MTPMLLSQITNRIISSLFLVSLVLMIAFAASCNRDKQTGITTSELPSQKDGWPVYDSTSFTHRGAVSESVYLHQTDVDYIAEKLSDSRKTESWWMGIISGTLLLLVGAQLAFNKNSTTALSRVVSDQGRTDQKVSDMEKTIDRHEEMIQGIVTKKR